MKKALSLNLEFNKVDGVIDEGNGPRQKIKRLYKREWLQPFVNDEIDVCEKIIRDFDLLDIQDKKRVFEVIRTTMLSVE
jgi:hypothetical protein